MSSKRLFIAIGLPPELRKVLSVSRSTINLPGISWVKEENMHITLLFLGNTDESKVSDIEQQLSDLTSFPSFRLYCNGLLPVIKRDKLTMIWAGFEQSKEYVTLAKQIAELLNHLPDNAPLPHVTLARVRKGQAIKAKDIVLPTLEPYDWEVQNFGLWESVLTAQGPKYTLLNEWILKGNP